MMRMVRKGESNHDVAVEQAPRRCGHVASADGQKVSLTPTEFRLLAKLVASQGSTVRRRDLVRTGWPHGARVRDNTLDAYVARLRRKLGDLPDTPSITTVHGVGYILE